MEILIIFSVLSIINVTFSTIRSLVTIKGNKVTAAIISGGYFAFYNIMLIYTVTEFPLWQKCLITFICNVIGVFLVKWGEELTRKDKLWKVELTVPTCFKDSIDIEISVPHSYIELSDKHTLFNFYCATQKESAMVKKIANKYNAKYFVSESKELF